MRTLWDEGPAFAVKEKFNFYRIFTERLKEIDVILQYVEEEEYNDLMKMVAKEDYDSVKKWHNKIKTRVEAAIRQLVAERKNQ